MAADLPTCWTVIRAAAQGVAPERAAFVERYGAAIRAYLAARWRHAPHLAELDDAVQEVFLECFRGEGALAKVDAGRPGGFRAFLYGVVRHVALRFEEGRGGRGGHAHAAAETAELAAIPADGPSLSQVFDREWARAIVRAAAERLAAQAADDAARRRVELLRRRFGDDTPIRTLAAEWQVDAARLHHEYARAREEFRAALHAVVAFHMDGGDGGGPAAIDRRCRELLALLGG